MTTFDTFTESEELAELVPLVKHTPFIKMALMAKLCGYPRNK
jgi:hypothetical protein